jgi:hypothetical protein
VVRSKIFTKYPDPATVWFAVAVTVAESPTVSVVFDAVNVTAKAAGLIRTVFEVAITVEGGSVVPDPDTYAMKVCATDCQPAVQDTVAALAV